MLIEIAYECFGEKHSKIDASNIKIPDSGNLKGIEQRAKDYLSSNTFANNWFSANERGLYFLKIVESSFVEILDEYYEMVGSFGHK